MKYIVTIVLLSVCVNVHASKSRFIRDLGVGFMASILANEAIAHNTKATTMAYLIGQPSFKASNIKGVTRY